MRRLTPLLFAGLLLVASVAPTFAATSTQSANTTVTVNTSIVLTGVPATIDFGSAAVLTTATAPTITARVVTNNRVGYNLGVVTSAMTSGTSSDTIPAPALNYAVTLGTCTGAGTCTPSSGHPADGVTSLLIATANKRTSAVGDTYAVVPSLAVPFVDGATYTGTAVFTATSL